MDNNVKCELRINGCGSSKGGVYNTVKINGAGKISGNIICRVFRINGSGIVNGSLDTEDGKINGSGKVEGGIKAQEFIINGLGEINGSVRGENIVISGSVTIDENLDVQNVKIEGSAKIGRDCNAEIFSSSGSFEIQGLLNADDIKIRLYDQKSLVTEIGGGKINVALETSAGLKALKNTVNPVLESEIIEGDEIILENTIAKEVRGTNVTVGRGCEIALVEYKGIFRKTGDAKVEEERKV
jgi:cytoskeletal protein CcmA (bactofilin family)